MSLPTESEMKQFVENYQFLKDRGINYEAQAREMDNMDPGYYSKCRTAAEEGNQGMGQIPRSVIILFNAVWGGKLKELGAPIIYNRNSSEKQIAMDKERRYQPPKQSDILLECLRESIQTNRIQAEANKEQALANKKEAENRQALLHRLGIVLP